MISIGGKKDDLHATFHRIFMEAKRWEKDHYAQNPKKDFPGDSGGTTPV